MLMRFKISCHFYLFLSIMVRQGWATYSANPMPISCSLVMLLDGFEWFLSLYLRGIWKYMIAGVFSGACINCVSIVRKQKKMDLFKVRFELGFKVGCIAIYRSILHFTYIYAIPTHIYVIWLYIAIYSNIWQILIFFSK